MDYPIYEAKIDEATDNITGIHAISFVRDPAIERPFIALQNQIKLSKSEKQVLTGAVLIPNQQIYRSDNQRGDYYLVFRGIFY